MLQRQIMLKQLQELQRRGQLQESGDARDQNFINPLSPLKQASGGQFPPAVNGTPVLDSSQMFMVGNMQMMQHGDSGVFPRFPNGLVLSQSQNLGVGHVGMSQPQLDMYLYGTPATNSDKNLNNYPYLQGPTTNLLSKNSSISLGMPALHPSAFGNAFMSQQCDFSSDQISAPNGSLPPNQFFQERNSFQQIPVQSINKGNLAGSYPEQESTTPSNALTLETEGRCEDTSWHGLPTRKSSNLGQSSLDPLEQKILYNADDHSWEYSFSRNSNIGTGGFTVENTSYMDAMSSSQTQNGSWSALMQSAVAETSSSDTGLQEEWSGLSFQNPGLSVDNRPTNFFDGDKQHNNWVDGNSPNAVSPSFKPKNLTQNSDRNCSYPGFQQSDHQHLRQQEDFHSESSHTSNQISSTYTSQLADYSSQLKCLTGVSHPIQTSLPSSNICPGQHKEHTSDENQSHILLQTNENQANNDFSGQDLTGTSWLDGSASYHVSGGVQKPLDDVNQLNISGYSTEEKMVPGHNFDPMSSFPSSPGFYSQSAAVQSESILGLLNKDDASVDHTPGVHLNLKVSNPNELPVTETSTATFSIPCNMAPVSQDFDFRLCPTDLWTPKPHSFFPSLSTGNSTATSSSVRTVKDVVKNQNPTPPWQSNMATNFPTLSAADAQEYSHGKIAHPDHPEFPLLDNLPVSQSVVISTPKSSCYSSLFRSLDSVSSSQENSSEVLNDQLNQSCFKHENNKQESLPCLGKSKDYEQRLEKRSSLHQGLTEINNSMLRCGSAGKQEILRKQYLEADAVSGPLVAHTHQQIYNQVSHVDKQTLAVPARDTRALGLNQNSSLLHPMHPLINADTDTDNGLSLPLKYDNSYYQQAIANARELLLSEHKSGVQDEGDLNFVPQLGASFTGDNKGWNLSPEVQGHLLGKASSSTHLQNFQQMEAVCQNGTERQSIGSNEASCVTYGSQISLQMAPSWFKHDGTFKNEQRLQVCDPNTAFNVGKSLTGTTLGNLEKSSLMMPANSANASQGICVRPSTDINLIARKQLSSPIVLPSDVIYQNLLVSMPKKRKIVAFDMVAWHKEVNNEQPKLQDISTAELEWAQASNRRLEEVKKDVEIVEDTFPFVPAKRRLIFTTQLMQKVFKPAPAAILCADASSNYDCVVYSTARLALGDTCSLIGQLSLETNVVSPDQQKTSMKTNGCGFTKVVEGLICRVNKLDGDLSRLHRTSLFADIKVENQELEKISIINRFAKFHVMTRSSTIDPATSSSKPIVQRTNTQRYVMALPMPRTVPEGIDCLSL